MPETQTEQTEYSPTLNAVPASAVPSPDNPPWSSGIAFGMFLLSVFLIFLVPAAILLPYLLLSGVDLRDSQRLAEFAVSDPAAILVQIIAILPAHLLTLGAAYLVVTWGRQYSFTQMLGWSSGGVRWWIYPAIIIGFAALAAAVTQFLPEQDNDLLRILRSSRSAVYAVAIVATLTAPLVEEVVYRGILYSAFQRSFGVTAAFLMVTVLFAAVHVPQYYPSTSTILLLTLLSVTLTALRIVSKNLWPCVLLHTIFNGLQSIGLILEPYLPTEPPVVDPAFFLSLIK